MANIMNLPDMDMQAIGSWTEIPEGGGRDPAMAKPRASMPMGIHYASAKLLRSLQVKQRCIDRLMELYQKKQPELALTEKGLLVPNALSWQELAALRRHFPDQPASYKGELVPDEPKDGDALGAPPVEDEAPAPLPLPAEPVDPATDAVDYSADDEPEPPPDAPPVPSPSTSDDDSSSASDCAAEGEDLVGVLAEATAAEGMVWFRQGKKIHVAAEEGEDRRRVPWCRESPFAQEPSERGVGFTMICQDQLCQRCRARMPRGIYSALAEHCGWVF